jgi:hypothetical protein
VEVRREFQCAASPSFTPGTISSFAFSMNIHTACFSRSLARTVSGLHAPTDRLGLTSATFDAASRRRHLCRVCLWRSHGNWKQREGTGQDKAPLPLEQTTQASRHPQHNRSSFLFLPLLLLLTITAISCLSVTPPRRHDYWFLVPGFFYRSQLLLSSLASILAVVGT